jgi:hypothetical protein
MMMIVMAMVIMMMMIIIIIIIVKTEMCLCHTKGQVKTGKVVIKSGTLHTLRSNAHIICKVLG